MANIDIIEELKNMRQLFADAAPDDERLHERYAWVVGAALSNHYEQLGPLLCRQLLADSVKLSIKKPSKTYSNLLRGATKIAQTFSDLHYVPFLNYWGIENLRAEDFEQYRTQDNKVFPSLAEKVVRQYLCARLYRPDEELNANIEKIHELMEKYRFHDITPMIVTRVYEAVVRGRNMHFVSLVSSNGIEVSCEVHSLRHDPKDEKQVHYVKVGQIYNTCIRDKSGKDEVSMIDAMYCDVSPEKVFPVITGYVESIDTRHSHIHIYDSQSRHFVSSGQSVNVKVGQYVEFVPVVPKVNKFKTAIVTSVLNDEEGPAKFGLRDIKITFVNEEKGYCSWEFIDDKGDIVELGTESPVFSQGYINHIQFKEKGMKQPKVGDKFRVVVFLKRGKDGQKRPRVEYLYIY